MHTSLHAGPRPVVSTAVESESRYRGLLEAAPDAMVVVDQAGAIVLLNLRTEKQFGYRRDELVGQQVKNIIPEGFAERLIADDLRSSDSSHARPFEPVDLGVIAAEVIEALGDRIERTGGRVEVGALPTIDADASQMRQLFQNLIGNGLKFHREGAPPVIRVGAERVKGTAASGKTVRLTVSDNGIGFDPRHADRIFVTFERLHGRAAYEGTGIGLAICHKIERHHAGQIVADGRPGEVATFSVTLPLRQSPPLQIDAAA